MSNNYRKHTTHQAMEQSGATLLNSYALSHNYAYSHWLNQDTQVSYHDSKVHTLSLYLAGGYGTSLQGDEARHGYQGAICLLPQNSESVWNVNGSINLCHFYFTDQSFRRYLVKTHDIEPAHIEIPELIFNKNKKLRSNVYKLFQSINHNESNITREASIISFFEQLYRQYSCTKKTLKYHGGLSPIINKRLKDYIRLHLSENISLKALSSVANLSEYHLQRMFKYSNGITPHDYLIELRVDKVKQMLGKHSLFHIAICCGFSNQSHMTRTFKKHTGATPLQYLGLIRNVDIK
jgi:AraC family transcriptional regulator